MDFSDLSAMAVTSLTFAVVAIVELYKRIYDKDYKAAGIIAVSGVVGAVLAPYAGDLTWFQGLLVGFSGSGVITVAQSLRQLKRS